MLESCHTYILPLCRCSWVHSQPDQCICCGGVVHRLHVSTEPCGAERPEPCCRHKSYENQKNRSNTVPPWCSVLQSSLHSSVRAQVVLPRECHTRWKRTLCACLLSGPTTNWHFWLVQTVETPAWWCPPWFQSWYSRRISCRERIQMLDLLNHGTNSNIWINSDRWK